MYLFQLFWGFLYKVVCEKTFLCSWKKHILETRVFHQAARIRSTSVFLKMRAKSEWVSGLLLVLYTYFHSHSALSHPPLTRDSHPVHHSFRARPRTSHTPARCANLKAGSPGFECLWTLVVSHGVLWFRCDVVQAGLHSCSQSHSVKVQHRWVHPCTPGGHYANVFGKGCFLFCVLLSSQIRIRDPNQGGRDITEEIMAGGSGSRNSTPPVGHPSSTPTPPQVCVTHFLPFSPAAGLVAGL